MTKIVIFGDSWSYESYKKGPNMQEMPGDQNFQKMFANIGIIVHNKSRRSGSNSDIIAAAKDNINLIGSSDLSIVFQTDPLRDVIDRKTFQPLESFDFKRYSGFLDLARDLLVKFYTELAHIQDQTKRPVLLIGGLSSLHFEHIPKTISTLPKSWTELVSPDFADCFFEWSDYLDLLDLYLNNPDELFEIKKQIAAKNYVWQNSEYFSWCHPSDLGYQVMFDTLSSYIKGLK